MQTKKCSASWKTYELSKKFFHKDPSKSSWFCSKCKSCNNSKKKSARQILKELWKRQCPICKQNLPLTGKYFHKDKSKLMWLANICKICKIEITKKNEINRTRKNQYWGLLDRNKEWFKWFVYILESNWLYKIWITTNKFTLKDRVKKLQCWNPYKINVIHLIATANTKELEDRLHEKYKQQHINWEWYNLNDEQLQYLMWFDVIKKCEDLS
jgi:hypothetical protein